MFRLHRCGIALRTQYHVYAHSVNSLQCFTLYIIVTKYWQCILEVLFAFVFWQCCLHILRNTVLDWALVLPWQLLLSLNNSTFDPVLWFISSCALQDVAKHMSLPVEMQSSPSKLMLQPGRTAASDGPVSRRFHHVSMVNRSTFQLFWINWWYMSLSSFNHLICQFVCCVVIMCLVLFWWYYLINIQ